MAKLKSIYLNVAHLADRYFREGFTYRAASLAYTTLLAIVPLTMLTFAILSWFPFFNGIAAQLQNLLLQNFVASSAEIISQHLDHFLRNINALSWYNILFLAFIGLLMIYNINRAFRQVWRSQPQLNMPISIAIYFVFLLVSPVVLGGVIVLGTFALRLLAVNNLFLHFLQKELLALMRQSLVLVVFTLFNWILPFCRVKFRHALFGGFIATVLFESAKWGFVTYLDHFSDYRLVYGALAILPVFLVWLYVSWTIILLSALITNLIAHGVPKYVEKRLR